MLVKPFNINERLGYHLRYLREREGMSCFQLALLIDASPHEVAAYERGESRISAEQLLLASAAFQVPVLQFFA